jgi:hypothetical protein
MRWPRRLPCPFARVHHGRYPGSPAASATLGTVSPPALPAARKLEAEAPHGCCGQRRSPHRFTGARIVTIILISDQTSREVGIRSE